VRSNSDSWEETADIQAITNTVVTVSSTLSAVVEDNAEAINTRVDVVSAELDELETQVSDVTTTVADNSGAWGIDQHTYTLATLTDVDVSGVEHNSVIKYDINDQKWYAASDLHGEGQHDDRFIELHDTPVAYTGADQYVKVKPTNDGLMFVTLNTQGWDSTLNTVHSLSDTWATQTDITDLTSTVNTNSASWGEKTDITDLTSTVNTNSASWGEHQDLLDGDKLAEQYVPELCITRIYTVQTPADVVDLTPGTGIQRGDIVVVQTKYDNLVATTNDPSGAYDEATQTYNGYNKLAVPAASVNTVNGEHGPNVVLTSDDISDTDQTNKWVTQSDIDNWNAAENKYVDVTGDSMTGDLNTTARYLSGGTPLHEIFSTSNNIVGSLDVDSNISAGGDVTATSFQGSHKSGDGQTGITKNVNVGGNILHIVDGIIVGITDEA
jgi:hypothetical protein